MKLLVTGICGFIGAHFADLAARAGHQVIGLDALTYAGRSANLDVALRKRTVIGDVCDSLVVGAMLEREQPDAIVHFAAESHVDRSIESRDEFLRTNVQGTLTMLEEARDYWIEHDRPKQFRFVHVSTDEVYGSLGPADAPWTETSPYLPNNPYSASKAASDHLVRSFWHTFGLPAIVTHSSNNYGAWQHPEKLIPTLIRQAVAHQPMTLHGDGMNVRDWIHVDDHCDGLLLALTRGDPGQIYNFGGGPCERTNLEIASLIARALERKNPRVKLIDDRPGNDRRYANNPRHAYWRLGWLPGPPITKRLDQVIQWYLDNPNYEDDYGR